MMDPEHEAIFKILDRIDSKLDRTDGKIDNISSNCSSRYEICSTCRAEDKESLNKEINKRPSWTIMTWLLGGIFVSLAFLLVFGIETRENIAQFKTEMSIHTGKVIKNVEILPHDLGMGSDDMKGK